MLGLLWQAETFVEKLCSWPSQLRSGSNWQQRERPQWTREGAHYSNNAFTLMETFAAALPPCHQPTPYLSLPWIETICCCCPRNEPLSRITVKICVFCGPFKSTPFTPCCCVCMCVCVCQGVGRGVHCCCRLYLAVIIIKMSKIISGESIDERLKCSINARNALNDSQQRKRVRGGGGGRWALGKCVGWGRCNSAVTQCLLAAPRGGN